MWRPVLTTLYSARVLTLFNNSFISVAGAAAACLLLQQAPSPIFRGSTEVVVVDVQVTDRAGDPLDGLKAEDFALKVDGKARTIASANFWRLGDRPATVKNESFSTLGSPNPVSAESYVLFVVDPQNVRPEPSRILLDQAGDFMAKFDAAHAVGLMVVPERRLRHDFGVLRQPIAATIRQQLGIWDGQTAHSDFGATLNSLVRAIEELQKVDGRRSLVYFGDSISEERMVYVEDLARQANLSDVAIYVVASDSLVIPSVTERLPKQQSIPPGGEYGALGVLADSTGGRVFRRAVTGAIVLPRLERALSAHYVLTFNVEGSDKDGKSHKIEVKVNRKDVDLRFRKEFAR